MLLWRLDKDIKCILFGREVYTKSRANQALPSQLHPDLSSDEPLNSILSRVPVSASARSDDQPQPVRERQPRRSRPNKPNPIASSQLAIPKQPARVRSRFILVVRFLQSAKQR
ncbi:hypothetical protein F2Q69_00063059 [Brassica cretica]|uniref:Uncharacterized protein n=1 Tax=Brassica cretica TaxID=69181 RepID=A0A8S9RPD0_BRACR|nr:hypothetical protein F2Q69_00063059 [Brassica cretica]